MIPISSFLSKIKPIHRGYQIDGDLSACWEWQLTLDRDGYGAAFWDGKKNWRPHRWSYQFHNGELADDLVIDHLCRNRRCTNPLHLEPVTITENVSRGLVGNLRTHCRRGHELVASNLRNRNPDKKECLICWKIDLVKKRNTGK